MIRYTQGNLLDSGADALVNTVNTVGVMGKGIALMFKERFATNFALYAAACKARQVKVGQMFVTETGELSRPRWVINFPTKDHWKAPSRLEWVEAGLQDLKRVLQERQIQSVAIPPLGAGNGGLDWPTVKSRIDAALRDVEGVDIVVYEPIDKYQNVAKRAGVHKLTPARALICEAVRRYGVLGMECSLLEVQKLAWFLERVLVQRQLTNPLNLGFVAHRYGPFSPIKLNKLLDGLDGSYLHCEKRIADSGKDEVLWFDDSRKELVQAFLASEAKDVAPVLDATAELIDGFESPFGMELLASVDWLLSREQVPPTVPALLDGLAQWPAEQAQGAGQRKSRLFDARVVGIALARLQDSALYGGA
ncbi:type II toxin-antitoxin system antitoxin DNA ADP-ribosyl glycohydrolase DarG [Ideonella alba]|uniref:Macro domain-containing protein n=1 Tax=Ideonella alba TaxID=2824118 RepID=A0A941B9K9_9BURK|nr:macro domain-containing protein [Ideonella alba]MBQ0928860.1 macro domain-containing protein [Ideonella alba]